MVLSYNLKIVQNSIMIIMITNAATNTSHVLISDSIILQEFPPCFTHNVVQDSLTSLLLYSYDM